METDEAEKTQKSVETGHTDNGRNYCNVPVHPFLLWVNSLGESYGRSILLRTV